MVVYGDAQGSNSQAKPAAAASGERIGLSVWMDRVAAELDRTQRGLDPDAVHDLRVALRRCLSIADIYMALDPLSTWEDMRKAGRRLFKRLGDLRDAQVMKNWVGQLAGEQDHGGLILRVYLSAWEAELRALVGKTVAGFDRKKWRKWQERLAQRSARVPIEDPVAQQFALECWKTAYDLHRQALRNRSRVSFHRLRMGLKRFRYTVENFLPHRHDAWGDDLKLLQDALGESHDLFVLWRTALRTGALSDPVLRASWRGRIEEESRIRLHTYRSKTVGKGSLWPVWRAGLPRDHELRRAAEARIGIWASFRDPNFKRTTNVADLALQLFDGLKREKVVAPGEEELRSVLHTAAVLRHLGKKSGKSRYKLITKTDPPLGFPAGDYRLVALTVRHARDPRNRPEGKHVVRLSQPERKALRLLIGILCLADALAGEGDDGIRRLEICGTTGALIIYAAGYRDESAQARRLAAARHPLELACRIPILIRPLQGDPTGGADEIPA